MIFPGNKPPRLDGLDALRGLCAMVVVLGHIELPPSGNGILVSVGRILFHTLFNGVAAVFVFFVVSGLCIHLPQTGGRELNLSVFLRRRLTRIGIPMLMAWLLSKASNAEPAFIGIMWSLIAEVIYYLVYPIILHAKNRWGWKPIFVASITAALVILVQNPRETEYGSFGSAWIWILGLPVWLMGCLLAESISSSTTANIPKSPMRARIAILGASFGVLILRWHLGPYYVGYPWSMLVFGVFAWKWLEAELAWFRLHPPPAWMDKIGASSYSIYLIHVSIIGIGMALQRSWQISEWIYRPGLFVGSIAGAWLFYLVIEKPSHRLASSFKAQSIKSQT